MKNNTIDWLLIRAKVEGTLSEEDNRRLEAWMCGHTERRQLVERAVRYYATDEIPLPDEEQVDIAWQRFNTKYAKSNVRFIRRLTGWAVAASVILAVGCWWMLSDTDDRVVDTEYLQAVVLPDNGKACLILSDGTQVELGTDSLKNRHIDRQVGMKLDDTKLVYEQNGTGTGDICHTLRVPKGAEYSLVLGDGTHIWMNAGTELVYPVAFTGDIRKVRLSGEAYFEVAQDVHRPFIVETESVNVKVLGTSFDVNAYADEPTVVTTLVTGKVQLTTIVGNHCLLSPSEQAIVSKVDGQLKVREVNTSLYTAWRTGRFVFRDQTLKEIMRSLSRWYDITYEFSTPELETLCFYGSIDRYENVIELLRQFEKTGKVRFEYQNKKIMIRK